MNDKKLFKVGFEITTFYYMDVEAKSKKEAHKIVEKEVERLVENEEFEKLREFWDDEVVTIYSGNDIIAFL